MDEPQAFDFRSFHAQHKVAMIVACAENGVIGSDGDLPWHLPADLRHFMRSTRGCVVIMGRKTFESLDQPLPNRLNIVLSRTMSPDQPTGVRVVRDIKNAIKIAGESGMEPPIWIAGGGHVYQQAMDLVDLIVRTRVHTEVDGDTVFPDISLDRWKLDHSVDFEPDERHPYPMTMEWWVRV